MIFLLKIKKMNAHSFKRFYNKYLNLYWQYKTY